MKGFYKLSANRSRQEYFHHTLLLLALVLFFLPREASAQNLTVGNYDLLDRERAGRAVFEYTYRADITNAHDGEWNFHTLDDAHAAGKIASMVDRNGNRMTFDYDGEGRLSIITYHRFRQRLLRI